MAFTESQIGLFALTEDAQEGQAAFREKRTPTGRAADMRKDTVSIGGPSGFWGDSITG